MARVTCPRCNGVGHHVDPNLARLGGAPPMMEGGKPGNHMTCRLCGGTGLVEGEDAAVDGEEELSPGPRIFTATLVYAARDEEEGQQIADRLEELTHPVREMIPTLFVTDEYGDDEARDLGWLGDGSVVGDELDRMRTEWEGIE
jgi:hypothetical protein